jgi:hypothetical protein
MMRDRWRERWYDRRGPGFDRRGPWGPDDFPGIVPSPPAIPSPVPSPTR